MGEIRVKKDYDNSNESQIHFRNISERNSRIPLETSNNSHRWDRARRNLDEEKYEKRTKRVERGKFFFISIQFRNAERRMRPEWQNSLINYLFRSDCRVCNEAAEWIGRWKLWKQRISHSTYWNWISWMFLFDGLISFARVKFCSHCFFVVMQLTINNCII